MARELKLGLNLGYWAGGPPPGAQDTVKLAEELGYDSMWTSEAYGSDCLTPLAWWGSQTSELKLGTAIAQLSARTPAATAMAAMTLDHLSGGRLILGLGVSGPQVVEGWYGQEFAKPLARTREYIEILRRIFARQGPVEFDGEHYRLPLDGGTGLGKPLKASIHPLREDIPIVLGAEGPKNVALAAELCDGWLALFVSPHNEPQYREWLDEGFKRPGARRSPDDFEITAMANIAIDDDLERAVDRLRPMYALYFGGMGAKRANFHADVARRMGYDTVVDRIQELYLSGRKDEAAAAIPTELIEKLSLVGPPDKVRADLDAWRESFVSRILVPADPQLVRQMAELAG